MGDLADEDEALMELHWREPEPPAAPPAESQRDLHARIMAAFRDAGEARIRLLGVLALLVEDGAISSGRARELGAMTIEEQRAHLRAAFHPSPPSSRVEDLLHRAREYDGLRHARERDTEEPGELIRDLVDALVEADESVKCQLALVAYWRAKAETLPVVRDGS